MDDKTFLSRQSNTASLISLNEAVIMLCDFKGYVGASIMMLRKYVIFTAMTEEMIHF